jgi:CRISPR/Cas system-associated exonuclease Cas4 (RecB family)
MSLDFLAQLNAHPRDSFISFEAGPHLYTIKGLESSAFTSVTTWNHSHFGHFDADAIITQMMKGAKWTQSKYYGQTREEIKAGWEMNRDEAASAGTALHYQIECYYNGSSQAGPEEVTKSVEYGYFKNFLNACPDLKPYRTEWMIYHEELRLAGSIDMVYENLDGTLMIYDWKRAKDIVKATAFMKYAVTECISHLPDTNFWHYALQLNTYKAILEEKYGKVVTRLALVCLHPTKKNYEVIILPVLTQEIKDLFALRREELTLEES